MIRGQRILNQPIDDICDLDLLDEIISDCQKRKITLIESDWEKLYKDRCKEYFMTLERIFFEFSLDNQHEEDYEVRCQSLEEYYYKHPRGLSRLLNYAEILELRVPLDVGKMTCAACMCGGCVYQEECCGYTCKECRPHYTGYQWVCEE